MAATVIIPARFESTRFPAKMLAHETGRPLVQHVVDRVNQCRKVRQVIVAADDQRIVDALASYGTRCVMTSVAHQSGTDRIAEVAQSLNDEIIVNVQGDEPEIEPELVDGLIQRLEQGHEQMATAATVFPAGLDVADPNLVKVIINKQGCAIYFSRSVIPYQRDKSEPPLLPNYLHLGIYAYTRAFLLKFAALEPSPLERVEKLEQLRAIEHGWSIYVLKTDRRTHGIDTPQQYAAFVERFRKISASQL